MHIKSELKQLLSKTKSRKLTKIHIFLLQVKIAPNLDALLETNLRAHYNKILQKKLRSVKLQNKFYVTTLLILIVQSDGNMYQRSFKYWP